MISAPSTTEVRKLLSCWSSSGGAESWKTGPSLASVSCSCVVEHVVPTAMQCEHEHTRLRVRVCTTLLCQAQSHQFYNCAMQGTALGFSGENGVIALS